jgi:hypothetical protein
MLQSLADLMDRRLRVAERNVRAVEVFFDPKERRLRYLAVDIGGWFDVEEVLVSAELLVPPDDGRDHWSLRLDADALAAAPRWGERVTAAPADLTGWPPVIVGPFGGTYAPMLLYEQMMAAESAVPSSPPETGPGEALVHRLERATEWLGAPAFGTDGELGRVDDILFDIATLKLARLVLGSGGLLSHRAGEVPIAAVRHMARQGTHLVLDIAHDDVAHPRASPADARADRGGFQKRMRSWVPTSGACSGSRLARRISNPKWSVLSVEDQTSAWRSGIERRRMSGSSRPSNHAAATGDQSASTSAASSRGASVPDRQA